MKNQQHSTEIINNTISFAFNNMKHYNENYYFKSWFYKILINNINDFHYKNNNTDLEYIDQNQNINFIKQISELNDEQTLFLCLNIVAGYTAEDISKLTDHKISYINSNLKKSRNLLKKYLN